MNNPEKWRVQRLSLSILREKRYHMDVRPIRVGRFVLTKMTAADSEKYYRLSNNDQVMKYVTGYGLDRKQSDEMLRTILAEYGPDTYLGRYLIEGLESNDLIGAAKIDKVGGDIEIGYRIGLEHWGKGIATEIAAGLIRFSRDTLCAANVIAYVNVDNAASIRVLEKAGMKKMETIEDVDEIKYKFVYAIRRNETLKQASYVLLLLLAIALIAAVIFTETD